MPTNSSEQRRRSLKFQKTKTKGLICAEDEADIFSALFSDVLLSLIGKWTDFENESASTERRGLDSVLGVLVQNCLIQFFVKGLAVIFLLICVHTGSLWLVPQECFFFHPRFLL